MAIPVIKAPPTVTSTFCRILMRNDHTTLVYKKQFIK